MRLYSLVNTYLSGIQKGIQTAHAISELHNFSPYLKPEPKAIYEQWALKEKTIIVLDYGNSYDLSVLKNVLDETNMHHDFPFSWFKEDIASLNGALTAVVFIAPNRDEVMYNSKYQYKFLMDTIENLRLSN